MKMKVKRKLSPSRNGRKEVKKRTSIKIFKDEKK